MDETSNSRIRIPLSLVLLSLLLLVLLPLTGETVAAEAQSGPLVVINEIQYHPASEDYGEEYIELYNPGTATIDLSGWRFSDGIAYAFPEGASIAPGGYVVVGLDPTTVEAVYGVGDVWGPFDGGRFSNGGERVALEDAQGGLVDEVIYDDHSPWPEQPDGQGPALELINPAFDNDHPCSWKASRPLKTNRGTPGRRNSVYSTDNIPPCITSVTHDPIWPMSSQPVVVTAWVDDNIAVEAATLYYRPEAVSNYTTLAMVDDGSGGDATAGDSLYTAVIPAQGDGLYVEFYITAMDDEGAERTVPGRAPGRTSNQTGLPITISYLYQVEDVPPTSTLPIYRLIMTNENLTELTTRDLFSNVLLDAAFVYGGEAFYNVGVRYRGEGTRVAWPRPYRVKFRDEHEFEDRERLNLVSDALGREALTHDLFQRAGLPASDIRFVTFYINENQEGDYLDIEQVDNDFLEAHFPGDDDGNLYRGFDGADLRYRGPDPESYEAYYLKKNNQDADDYADIIALTDALTNSPAETFRAEAEMVADMRQWLRWFAVQAVLDNHEGALWLGQGDDYFLYHRPSDDRFVLISWDHDTTFRHSNHSIWEPDWGASDIVERILRYPEFSRWYYQDIASIAANEFSVAEMYPRIDALPDVVSSDRRDMLKQYVAERIPALESQIPDITLSIGTNGGADFHTSHREVTLEGNCSPLRDVYVNGDQARIQYPTPTTWHYTGTLWTWDNGFIITDGLDSQVVTVYWDAFHGGTLSEYTALQAEDYAYVITQDIVVPAGVTLTIEPGTTLEFQADRTLRVEGGRLLAEGTITQPIVFTRQGDGYWGGILFDRSHEDNRISHAVIEYTHEAISSPRTHGVSAYGSRVTIADSVLRNTSASVAFQSYPWEGHEPTVYLLRNEIYNIESDAVHVTGGYAFVQGNHIHDVSYGVYPVEGIEVSHMSTPAVLLDNHLHDVSDDCMDLNHSSAIIERNELHDCGDKGISIGHPGSTTLTNNLIYGCVGDDVDPLTGAGIAVKDGAVSRIVNNTVISNRYGINLYEGHEGQGGGVATVVNSILWGNGTNVGMDALSTVTVTHSDVGGGWSGEGNIDADPLFRDPQSDDYRLLEGSPCIDTATEVGAPSEDIQGLQRPQGWKYDRGAHEFPAVLSITTNGGADFATPVPKVTLEGTRVSSRTVYVNGGSASMDYPSMTTWRYTGTLWTRNNGFVVTDGVDSRTITVYWDAFHGGTLTEDVTLLGSDYPYLITESITVPAGITLTVEPSVTLRFQAGLSLIVEGRLVAVGTSSLPVVFTRDGSGLWGGVLFRDSAAKNHIAYATVEYAGDSGRSAAGVIEAYSSTLRVEHSTIRHLGGTALFLEDSQVEVFDNVIYNVLMDGVRIVGGDGAVRGNHVYHLYGGQVTGTTWLPTLGATIPSTGTSGTGIGVTDTYSTALVQDNWVHDVVGDCVDVNRADAVIERNKLYRCGDEGISVGEALSATLVNNLVYGCLGQEGDVHSGAGIAVKDGTVSRIVNNTVADNRYGIYVYQEHEGDGGSAATVVNSIVWGNEKDVELDARSVVTVTYCDVYPNVGTVWPGEGNISADPLFRAPDKGDYRSVEKSPCVDTGTAVGAPDEDMRGIYRPHGEGYDMGAYEFFEYFSCYLPVISLSY